MALFGIIYSAFQAEGHVHDSLAAWVKAREVRLGGHDFRIVAVSVPFSGFETGPLDGTQSLLRQYKAEGDIDHLIDGNNPMPETEARGIALQYLMENRVDWIWQFDSDERITVSQLNAIIYFIEAQSMIQWFRIAYKNYVFTPEMYIIEPFTPARIHRSHAVANSRLTGSQPVTAAGFWADNNIFYASGNIAFRDIDFSSMTVPPQVAWLQHFSWLNDERSRKKVAYQTARGWQCSFRWNEATGLEFNAAYFAARGLALPKVARDSG